MKTKLFLLFLLFSEIAFAQKTEKPPAEINAFIPAGFEVLDFAKGDINNDKTLDYVLVCKSKKEAEDGGLPRPMLLILQDANKKYKISKRSEKIIMCAGCGGVMGDPFSGIEIKDGNFTIQHYGGSSWRWSKDATFRFDGKNNWVLNLEKNITFHTSEPEKTTREYSIPENEFLLPKTLDNYTGEEEEQQVSNWKVKAEKTFFHSQTNEKTVRKAFLVKGNKVETFVETKNFVWVEYPKTDEFKRGTLGFILKKDLEKMK